MPQSIFDYAASLEKDEATQTIPSIFDYEDSLKQGEYLPPMSIFDYEDINRYGIPVTQSFRELQEKVSKASSLSTESDLEPRADPSILSSFGRGFGAGLLPFGIYEPEMLESPTTSEKVAETFGTVAGSVIPYVLGSLVTGGAALPVLGARTAAAASTLQRIGRANKQIKRLNKLASGAKGAEKSKYLSRAASLEKGKSRHLSRFTKMQDEFIEEELKKGLSPSKISKVARRGFPQASGQLGKIPGYQDFILGLAKTGPKGVKWANAVNRGINNLATFTAVGQIYKPLDASLEERLSGLGSDMIASTVFTAAAMPKIFWSDKAGLRGKAAGRFGEYTGVALAGAFSDLGLNKDMTWEDRIIHGLALMGVHGAGEGLSRVGIKQKAFNALGELGIAPETSLKLIEGEKVNRLWDAAGAAAEQKGDIWRSKTNPDNTRFIEKGDMYESEDGKLFEIKYTDSDTGVDYYRGPNKASVIKQLSKDYYREKRPKEVLEPEASFKLDSEGRLQYDKIEIKERLRTIATAEEKAILKGDVPQHLKNERAHWEKIKKITERNLKESKKVVTRDAVPEPLPGTRAKLFKDELFNKAVSFVVKHKSINPPLLQRNLKVKYSEAQELIDKMEKAGIVSKGGTNREVLITKDDWHSGEAFEKLKKEEKVGTRLWDLRTWHSEGSKTSDKSIDKNFYEKYDEYGEFEGLKINIGDNVIVPEYRGRGWGGMERSFDYNKSTSARVEAVGEKSITEWMKDNPDKFVDKDGVLKYDDSTILLQGLNADPAAKGDVAYYLAKVNRKSDFSNEIADINREYEFSKKYEEEAKLNKNILPNYGDTVLFHSVDPDRPFNRSEARRRGKISGHDIDLKPIINDFVIEMQIANYSPKTIESYKNSLAKYFQFISDKRNRFHTGEISRGDVQQFVLHLQDKGHKPASIKTIMGAVKSWHKHQSKNELASETILPSIDSITGEKSGISYQYTSEHIKNGEPIYFYIAGPKGRKIRLSKSDESRVREFYKDKDSNADPDFIDKLILRYTGGKGMTQKEYSELPTDGKKQIWGEKLIEEKFERQYISVAERKDIIDGVLEKHFGKEKGIDIPYWKAKELYGEKFIKLAEKAIDKASIKKVGEQDPGSPYKLRMFVRNTQLKEHYFRDFVKGYGRKKLIDAQTKNEVVVPYSVTHGSSKMSIKKFESIRKAWDNHISQEKGELEKKLLQVQDTVNRIESGEIKEADIAKLSTDAPDPSPESLRFFETSMVNRNLDDATPMYTIKLKKWVDGKKTRKDVMEKDTKYLFTDNELLFRTEAEAVDWARNHWNNPESANRILQNKLEQSTAKLERLKPTIVQTSRSNYERKLNDGFKNQNFTKKAQESLISAVIPESGGKIENLSEYGIRMISDYIFHPNLTQTSAEMRFNLSINNSNTHGGRIASGFRKAWRNMREAVLPVSNIIQWFDVPAAREISFRKMKPFTRTRQSVSGPMTEAMRDMEHKVGRKISGWANPMKDISKYFSAFVDEATFGQFMKHKEFRAFEKEARKLKIEGLDGIEWLKKRHKQMMDEVWQVLVGSNAYIVDSHGKRRRMARFYNRKTGKEFNYVDLFKDPESWDAQVSSFLDYAQGKKTKVLDYVDGELREVSVNKTKSKVFYEEPFLHRVVTPRFKELFSTDENSFKMMSQKIMETDKEIKLLKGKEKREAAEEKARTLQKMISKPGVYGQVHSRVANLPPFIYVKRVNDRVVDLIDVSPEFNHVNNRGKFYKDGDKITDRHSIEHTIDEVIPVYENNYGKVMEQYIMKIPHFAATSLVYSNRKTGLIEYKNLAERLARETGDREAGKFAEEQMELQIHGQEVGAIEQALRWTASKSAIAGLSFPISGIKNAAIGNVMNATVFTTRDLVGGLKTILAGGADRPLKDTSMKNWMDARSLTRRIGAEYTSNYSLFMSETPLSGFAQRWIGNFGGMRTTEFANRMISAVTGQVALKNHIHNFAGIKTPSNKGISLAQSRRILVDVFEFSPKQIERMVGQYRAAKERLKDKDMTPEEKMKLLNVDYFTNQELNQAQQQAHMITQGSPDLPYVPYWMGRAWAKPLTLFYRIAYRMTNAVADNVIMPIITDGNMMPAMKYIGLNIPVGAGLYSIYHWALGEERQNQFQSMPAEYLDYFMKAEGLAIFSNLFDDYGGFGEAYYPIPIRNTEEFLSNVFAWLKGEKNIGQAADDGLSSIVAGYNGWKRFILHHSEDKKKQMKESRRRQNHFLDTFFPKEDTSLDYDDMLTTKTPYYRALSDVFWSGKPEYMALEYYASLAYVRDRFMHEQQLSYYVAENKARKILKGLISRQRPIPSSWRKARGRKSKYLDYIDNITPKQREEEKVLDSLYLDYKTMFWKAVNDYRDVYYKKG